MSLETAKCERRWYHLTPGRFVAALLVLEIVLALSERFQWFAVNRHKGWTLLIATAALASAVLVLLTWFAISRLVGRRFQFSLRTLLLFVLVCAVQCSWWAVTMRKVKTQREAREAITRLGGSVGYDYEYEHWKAHDFETGFQEQPVPPGPELLRAVAGDDLFDTVMTVSFYGCVTSSTEGRLDPAITDDDMEILSAFPRLREGHFIFQPITDRSLETLSRFREIESVDLYGTQITDRGLASLANLPRLKQIGIGGTPASVQGIAAIRERLPALESVEVDAAQLQAAGGWSRAEELLPGVRIVRVHNDADGLGGSFEVNMNME
ncbi:MAG: hypothetical protein NTW96_09880 [Planctomycetia bacterium]|nr:hypothetical protein [Planctomycetia bacterium]